MSLLGLFCNKIGAGIHTIRPIQTFRVEHLFSRLFLNNFTSQLLQKVDDLYCFSCSQYISLINRCLLNISYSALDSALHLLLICIKSKFLFTLKKGPSTQITYATYSLIIYINFFSSLEKGAGAPYRRVPSQKRPWSR